MKRIYIELGGRFPWVRRYRPFVAVPTVPRESNPHRSWVMTPEGRGWLHHHDPNGFWVQLDSGDVKCFSHSEIVNEATP